MQDVYHDDLRDFVRYGKLDAYELTDEELARLLDVWRWSVWTKRTGPDFDVHDLTFRLERRLMRQFDVEVEYNTRFALKHELEPLMYLRVLLDLPRALWYFANPRRWRALVQSIRHVRRYRHIRPVLGEQVTEGKGYPRPTLESTELPCPNLLKRRYWRRISDATLDERERASHWW